MKQVAKDLKKLKSKDIINILLYGLYKLTGVAEYSAISELAYTLDKDSLFNLCATFGGCTIKVPTLAELKTVSKALLIIDLMTTEEMSFLDACDAAEVDVMEREDVVSLYNVLADILETYE